MFVPVGVPKSTPWSLNVSPKGTVADHSQLRHPEEAKLWLYGATDGSPGARHPS